MNKPTPTTWQAQWLFISLIFVGISNGQDLFENTLGGAARVYGFDGESLPPGWRLRPGKAKYRETEGRLSPGSWALEAGKESFRLDFSIALDPTTARVGLWYKSEGEAKAPPVVKFFFRDDGGHLLTSTFRPFPLSQDGPSSSAEEDGWALLDVAVPKKNLDTAFEKIEGDTGEITGPLTWVSVEVAPPPKTAAYVDDLTLLTGLGPKSSASYVWKLREVDLTRQPNSKYFSKGNFCYGHDQGIFLRAAPWFYSSAAHGVTDPWAPMTPEASMLGVTRVAVLVRDPLGRPVWATNLTAPFREWSLPQLPLGSWRVELRRQNAQGLLVSDSDLELVVLDDRGFAGKRPAIPPNPSTLFAFAVGANARGDFRATWEVGEIPALRLAPLAGAPRASIALESYGGETLGNFRQNLNTESETLVPLALLPKDTAAWARVTWLSGNEQVMARDAVLLATANRPKEAAPFPARGMKGHLDFFNPKHPRGYISEGLIVSLDGRLLRRLPHTDLPVLFDQVSKAANVIEITFMWNDVNPLPGVYQFAPIQNLLDEAAKRGLDTILALQVAGDQIPRWLWHEQVVTAERTTLGHHYSYASPASANFRTNLMATWEALVKKFRDRTNLVGWHIQFGGGEGLIRDTGDAIGDYGPWAQTWYRGWQKARGRSPENPIPLMHFEGVRDPRPEAAQWFEAKQDLVAEHVDAVASVVRNLDPHRMLSSYANYGFGNVATLLPLWKKHRMLLMNGGAESFWSLFLTQMATGAGVDAMPEPHFTPPMGYQLNMAFFNNMLAGGFTGLRINHGMVWTKNGFVNNRDLLDLVPHKRRMVDGVLPALVATRPQGAMAILFSHLTRVEAKRSFCPEGFTTAPDDLKDLAYGENPLTPLWVNETTTAEQLRGVKLLVDSDTPVITEGAAAMLAQYLKDGGTVFATGFTGMAGTDRAQKTPYPWLEKIGVVVALDLAKNPTGPKAEGTWEQTPVRLEKRFPWVVTSGALPKTVLATGLGGEELLTRYSIGKGQFYLASGEIKWSRNKELFGKLTGLLGLHPPARVSAPGVLFCNLVDPKGRQFMPLFRQVPDTAARRRDLKREEVLSLAPVQEMTLTWQLGSGNYRVTELVSGRDFGVMTDGALMTSGVSMPMAGGDLRVLMAEPMAGK